MSGPALKQLESHHAIHEAAFQEAQEMTLLFHRLCEEEEEVQRAILLTEAIVEHWQTRTLRHAAEEEVGFYRDWCEQHPGGSVDVAQLTRDHDLMRNLIDEVMQLLNSGFDVKKVGLRLDMLLWVNETHSRDEERCMLKKQPLRRPCTECSVEERRDHNERAED